MSKKISIIGAGGNELANQLWNYASIYAYCLERGLDLKNPSFFEYGSSFEMSAAPNWLFKVAFFLPFEDYRGRKTAFRRRLWRKAYSWYARVMFLTKKQRIFSYEHPDNIPFYLAPTTSKEALPGHCSYLDGWLFRNPVGLEKYRNEIRAYFAPKPSIQKTANDLLTPIRQRYQNIVGVHVRQGDYRTWRNGAYFIEQKRVREILNEYLQHAGTAAKDSCFVIASDGPIDESVFAGLNIVVSKNGPVEDLFMLAQADVVIGSNSTFGDFAAYYGNIPHIVMTNEPVDWGYYAGKNTFFPNKYCTWVHY
ncbi:MAG: alpha-1,2-fucosyltransferase [Patescibacteria group bacterium]